MKQLVHNGVLLPKKYELQGFPVFFRGKELRLTAEQEEMAVAWVKKLETDYVKDPVFVRNFFRDFAGALNIKEKILPEDFDFSAIREYVERERLRKLNLSREEKKALAEARRVLREANKERYGYAVVDSVKVEVANYTVEPPSIFMGRGKHPLRGRWKPGVTESDITLNLSPDAPIPAGNWKAIVWEPESIWIANWRDKLRGKMKYVWISDTAHIKQLKEIEKYDRARELEDKIDALRVHIIENLGSTDPFRRKVATVCYLIDALKLRVGDEKGKDEADTVGATTLRPKHISFEEDGMVTLDFLGKDSVKWTKKVSLPNPVINNLKIFASDAQSSMFKGVRSEDVTSFLGEVMPGLTAKVFRTYHASKVVDDFLRHADVSKSSPDLAKKYTATMANLQAAIICNHKRKRPKNWRESLRKKTERLRKLRTSKTKRSKEALKKLRLQIKIMKRTVDYNLNTSLKSYIDPRIYHDWGRKVDFDWKLYYPKALQRKFSWVDQTS